MNRGSALWLALTASALGLTACSGLSRDPNMAAAYDVWLQNQLEITEVEPFEPEPMIVSGKGEAKATPDVAVLSGVITAKADYEFQSVDKVSKVIDAVQTIIGDKDITLSFTDMSTTEERDPKCLEYNYEARARNLQIYQDYFYNKQIRQSEEAGHLTSKPLYKKELPRIEEKVCPVTHVKTTLGFTAWINPADKAGDYINQFAKAGVQQVDLTGYDFSDYDALYQEAAENAVRHARKKAELAAKTAGTTLKEITEFHVSEPARVTRLGQQTNVISPYPADKRERYKTVTEPVVVQEASTELITLPPVYEMVKETIVTRDPYTDEYGQTVPAKTKEITRRVVKTPARTVERSVPAVTRMETRRVLVTGDDYAGPMMTCWDGSVVTASQVCPQLRVAQDSALPYEEDKVIVTASHGADTVQSSAPMEANSSNLLKMTLLAGPQVITVYAQLGYSYETPLNGVIITDPEDTP